MPVEILLCAVGLALLTVAADHLVLGSSRLAARLRINPIVVGVVVIGLGTSTPEFLVSGSAAARGDTGLAVGNLVGSNILNLTLILGVAAMIALVRVEESVVRREARLAVLSIAAFGLFAWWGLTFAAGVLLGFFLIAAVVILVRWARAERPGPLQAETGEFVEPVGRTPVELMRAAGGLAGVLLGAQLLVVNASAIATRFGTPQVVIGFTLVALGTSLPELVTTVQAQRRGESDLVVGNLFGSNLFNSLGGGSIVALTSRSPQAPSGSAHYLIAMLLTALLAWLLLRHGYRLTRLEGLCLLGAYLLTLPLLLS